MRVIVSVGEDIAVATGFIVWESPWQCDDYNQRIFSMFLNLHNHQYQYDGFASTMRSFNILKFSVLWWFDGCCHVFYTFTVTYMILKGMTVAMGLVNFTYSQCAGLGVQNLHIHPINIKIFWFIPCSYLHLHGLTICTCLWLFCRYICSS